MSTLTVENLSKTYDGAPLLRDISFVVAAGEIVCLLGPSGTGKTTLLRCIAGLEQPEGGRVLLDGRDLANVPPHERGIGFMFQDLALFPHRNVYDNVAFGLRMQNASANVITARVHEMLTLVGLDPAVFAARDVNRLSGGEQQRVALARTLAPRPRLVMFDEPLGALDRILREELVDELRTLLKRLGMTALYVTHDQDEAFAIADRLILLHAGSIQQEGTPVAVYAHPRNAFVARFMGLTNLIPIQAAESRGAVVRARTAHGEFVVPTEQVAPDARHVLLRPRAIANVIRETSNAPNTLRVEVTEAQLRAGRQRIVVVSKNDHFVFEWEDAVPLGEPLTLELNPAQIQFVSD